MSIDQIAAEALRLRARERALLAESLWESLSAREGSPPKMDDRAALDLAQGRGQQIEQGKVAPLSDEGRGSARLRPIATTSRARP